MTGPDHYVEAERLLGLSTADNPVTAAEAQAHATLALVAAMALLPFREIEDVAWAHVLGEPS